MIFKVFYQESLLQVPVRENTKVIYVEAENEREVRRKLENRRINIEYIQPISGAFLEYEKKSEDFKVEKL